MQTALYKLPTNIVMKEENFDIVTKPFNIKYTAIEKEYTFFEASGKENEIADLTQLLHQFELVEFVKSAPISLFKSTNGFVKDFAELEKN